MIVGTNAHEMTLFVMMDPSFGALDDDAIRTRVAATTFGAASAAVVDDYRRRRPDATPQELWVAISTDAVFRMPAILTAMAQQGHGPVWSYLLHVRDPGVRRRPAVHPRTRDPVRVRHRRPGGDVHREPARSSGQLRTPCTARGAPSPAPATPTSPASPSGPSTSPLGAPRCGSTPRARCSTTPARDDREAFADTGG